ncbi:HK97-gp10 family putative phage morphogenesis protein [Streptomyces sp. bgisy032]|uniref:HK97-gp10 family putative phage morphogenesis protein n=1 Tax=Streptomyces sp. bgisy032 TaxID=3413773 RepID=UPI003D72F627
MSRFLLGLDTALSRVRRMPQAARSARTEVLDNWAEDTKGLAKSYVPERTGNLMNAIEDRKYEDAAYVGVYQPDQLEYAQFVEKGTSSMEEQPYLVPAFEAASAGIAREFRDTIRRYLEV